MPAVLRVQPGRLLAVDSSLLDPDAGCGLMLAQNAHYEGNYVFFDVMRRYGFPNVFADRMATGIIDEREDLMRDFCHNVDAVHSPLELNFRTIYASCNIILALDSAKHDAHFVADPGNRLALTNYFRDAIPGIAKALGITITGWRERLLPVGWQNLYDVTREKRFILDYPDLKRIDITPGVPTIEWHGPALEIGVNVLNLSDARTIRHTIRTKAEKAFGNTIGNRDPGSGIQDPNPEAGDANPKSKTQEPKPDKDRPPAPSPNTENPNWPEI
jgi:hypothetical protein